MAEEFQAGVCSTTTWWNMPRSSLGLLSQCSVAINNDVGSFGFGWPSDDDLVDMNKARSGGGTSTDESGGSVCDGSIVFQDILKPHGEQPPPDSGGKVLMDSTLQMMGIGLSSSSSSTTTDWNQTLLGDGRSESNYQSSMLQEDMNSRLNFRQETRMDCPQIQREWSMKNFSITGGQDSTINEFKPANQSLNSEISSSQGLPASFPMSSASFGYPSTLLQTLFDTDPQPQQSIFNNRSMNYPSSTNYATNLNEFSPSLAKLSSLLGPSLPKQQPISPLNSTNNVPFWNASTAALNDFRFLASTFEEKSSCPNLATKPNSEVVQDSASVVKKSSSEPAFKKQRIETPSPLPTFKVRKEKLGDRITALQQLVSPFGKTDTASVLQEAIEYIKFLHEQVSVLRTPYMKNGAPIQHQETSDKLKDSEGPKQDLRSRGLCLVPISSTYPVANETTTEFWTPTFGGTFR